MVFVFFIVIHLLSLSYICLVYLIFVYDLTFSDFFLLIFSSLPYIFLQLLFVSCHTFDFCSQWTSFFKNFVFLFIVLHFFSFLSWSCLSLSYILSSIVIFVLFVFSVWHLSALREILDIQSFFHWLLFFSLHFNWFPFFIFVYIALH